MADRIKGITIEIGGETTGLSKALKGVNGEIKNTQAQLKDVERLLKLDPTNTQLLEQRQKLLNDAVGETKNKLDQLKEAEKQVQQQMAEGKASQEQYDALQREIAATENNLKALEKEARNANVTLAKIGATAEKVGSGAKKVADSTRALSAAAGAAIAGIGAAAVNAAAKADELNTMAKRSGFSTEELQKMQYAAEMIDVDVDTITGSMSKMRKNMVSTSSQTTAAWQTLGVAVRDANGELCDSDTVYFETLQALSQINNETERDTLAMQLFGKSADQLAGIVDDGGAALKEYGDEAERLGLVMSQDTLNALNDVNDKIDSLKAQAQATLAVAGANAMDALMPILDGVIAKIGEALQWIGSLDGDTIKLILTIAAAVAAISPVASLISKISSLINTVLIPALNFLMANPLVALIAAVVALTALIATKGDEIQAVLQKVDEFLQSIFVKDWSEQFGVLGDILNAFFATVSNVWDAISGVFNGIIDFIRGVFTGNWQRAWEGVKEIFRGVFDGLVAIAKAPLNAIIGLINGVISGLNFMIRGINKLSFEAPDWVPELGGKTFGFNIPEIGKIPYLAKGGILTQGSAIVGEAGAELLTVGGGRAVVQPLTANVDSKSLAAALGSAQGQTVVNVQFSGSLAQLGHVLQPVITAETMRRGASLVGG